MTQHSTRTASPPASNSLRGRLLKRSWPVRLVLVAALLLAVPFLFHAGSTVHAADNEITGVTLTSPNPGELVITWDAPSDTPDDYRVTWKKSDGKWPSYKNENTAQGGNAFQAERSHTVTGLEEGTEYSARVRARYHNSEGNVEESGPWSTTLEIAISSTPAENTEGDSNEGDSNEGDSNEGRSTSPPAKPTGLSTNPSHDSVDLSWTDPSDDSITSYQVLRGSDADNLAVLVDNTGKSSLSYTDSTVTAETTYAYAIRARNADGLSPQTDAVSTTTQAAPLLPAKPTGLLPGRSHDRVLLFWDDPGDDSITGYQILRGPDAANLTVLTNDTGSASASYTDDTVEEETEYFYAIRARNAEGLGPQSDPISVRTLAAPVEPESDLAVAGVEFTLDGQELDTTGTCSETDVTTISAGCTINIETKSPVFAVDGTLDSDDRIGIRTGRDLAAAQAASEIATAEDLRGTNQTVTLTFPEGRSLLRLFGDENEVSGGSELHFFRVNVVPYWELSGHRLSKDSACQSITTRTAAQITDSKCILTNFKTGSFSFHNVLSEHFNVYVDVNTVRIVDAPDNTALANPFTLDLQDGDNVLKVRPEAIGVNPHGETYGSNSFYYKVTGTDVAVSNLEQVSNHVLGQTSTNSAAVSFKTGSYPDGYKISAVRLSASIADTNSVPHVSIYSNSSGEPSSSLKVLANPDSIPVSATSATEVEFGAGNYRLAANTTYWILLDETSPSGKFHFDMTASTSEDANGAPDWEIGDSMLSLQSGSWATFSGGFIAQFAVKGKSAPPVSTDATLNALVLKDADNNVVTIDPTFASGVYSYTTTVANAVNQITVEPTKNDDNASIKYLNSTGTALTDADTNTAVFDITLAEGENVIKVEVTAEDGTTTKTYQVTVTRVDFLVSNLGQTDRTSGAHLGTTLWSAQQFETGTNPSGYTVSEIVVNFKSDVSGTFNFSINQTNDSGTFDKPSYKVVDLNGSLTTAGEHGFTPSNTTKLEPSTKYIVVLRKGTGGTTSLQSTGSDNVDPGSASDWNIANGSVFSQSSGSTWTSLSHSLEIAVKGTLLTGSDDATLSNLEVFDNEPTLASLTPAFDPAITEYTAVVANEHTSIELDAFVNDHSATVQFLDKNDVIIPIDSTVAPNISYIIPNIEVGENLFKIKVTAEDTVTTKTYQVTVTRVDFLVSNLGQSKETAFLRFANTTLLAMQFTTGSHATGYT